MFNAPSTGSGDILKPDEIVGQLLIVRPTSHETGIQTTFGEKDGIRCDVAVLTQQNLDGTYGVIHRDVLWLQGRLVGALKRQIGDLVLGRMGRGTGKPGQQPPFELQDATADAQAVAFAEQWMGTNPGFKTSMAAPTTPAPTATVAQVPATPAAIPGAATIPATPAAVPAAAVAVPATPAAPAVPEAAAAPSGGLDPAVLAALSPEALAQLKAALGANAA